MIIQPMTGRLISITEPGHHKRYLPMHPMRRPYVFAGAVSDQASETGMVSWSQTEFKPDCSATW